MWMLYIFKLTVFDKVHAYSFAADYALVTKSDEQRVAKVRRLINVDSDLILRRCVLVAGRRLSSREMAHLQHNIVIHTAHKLLWLAAEQTLSPTVLPSFHLYGNEELAKLQAKSPARFDVFPLRSNQKVSCLSAYSWRLAA